ncbi:MAG: hypothetical protein U0L62_02570 [Paludibacteraceae bacterium]|nr:hypothetical protein [Paludibacteraceae bacterium]
MEVQVHEYAWMWQRLGLSLAECRVFAFIYGLTKSKKYGGYDGSKRQLALLLGLDVSGTKKILDKLIDSNLISYLDGKWVSVESVQTNVESVQTNVESVQTNMESVQSPHTPLYNINNKNKAAMHEINFETFWDLFNPTPGYNNRTAAAKSEWDKCSAAKQKAIIHKLQTAPGDIVQPNPYFYIIDFPEPTPTNLNGTLQGSEMLNANQAKTAFYDGKWGLYSLEDIQLFNLKTLN